jgi:hypothetical protein
VTVPQLLQTVDDLVYQIVVLVSQVPKTLVRVVAEPEWAYRYVREELSKELPDRFDAYTSPALLWALIGVVPYLYLLQLLATLPGSRVSSESEWVALSGAGWEQRFLVVTAVAVALPLGFSLTVLSASASPVKRTTLREPFLTQCYLLTPAFVVLLPAVTATLRFDDAIPTGTWTIVTTGSWLFFWFWVAYAETRLFRAQLTISWMAAFARAVRGAMRALFIFIGLEVMIITLFNGLEVWLAP